MKRASILFEGDTFYSKTWMEQLRTHDFRLSMHGTCTAIYTKNGNHILASELGFIRENSVCQGNQWSIELKASNRWEGMMLYFSLLLSAFTLPQSTVINIQDNEQLTFNDEKSLYDFATKTIIGKYGLSVLIENGIYQEGYGFRYF